MRHTVQIEKPAPCLCYGDDMMVGNVGIIHSGLDTGAVVLRTYSGFVDLALPGATWGANSTVATGWKVEILPKGTKVTILLGEGQE